MDTARVAVKDYGLDPGQQTLHTIGSSVRVEYVWKPVREVSLETRFYFYTNYHHVEIDLEGSLGKYCKKSSAVNAACDWSGPIDLTAMDCGEHMTMGERSPEDILLGATLSKEPDKYLSLSATTYVDANDPPVIIFHGEKDNVVPCCQGKEFYKVLRGAGVRTEAVFVPEGGHGMGMYSEENLKKMVRFFDETRK